MTWPRRRRGAGQLYSSGYDIVLSERDERGGGSRRGIGVRRNAIRELENATMAARLDFKIAEKPEIVGSIILAQRERAEALAAAVAQ